jgi:hypothetical protein
VGLPVGVFLSAVFFERFLAVEDLPTGRTLELVLAASLAR